MALSKYKDAAQMEANIDNAAPRVLENGNWERWDSATNTWVDTGKPSKGETGGVTPEVTALVERAETASSASQVSAQTATEQALLATAEVANAAAEVVKAQSEVVKASDFAATAAEQSVIATQSAQTSTANAQAAALDASRAKSEADRAASFTLDLGLFPTEADLKAAHIAPKDGSFARVTATETYWDWEESSSAWVDSLVRFTGGGGNYEQLPDKPQINGVVLASGDNSPENLGLATKIEVEEKLTTHNTANNSHADIRASLAAHSNSETLHKTANDTAILAQVADKADKSLTLDYILLSTNWVGEVEPYKYTIANETVTTTSNQEFLPATTITKEELQALQQANIVDDAQSDGSLTIKAFGEKPTMNLPIKIIFRGD